MQSHPLRFPPRFVWGAATAALQIEGATTADGRGTSIWETFSQIRGKTAHGDTPENACDHYRRFKQDIALLRDLGLRHYRFSVAWPRIQPDGIGKPNTKGLDFYSRLVDALHDAGITPWITLYHWDLPQVLEDRGGWRVRATPEAFGKLSEIVVRHLGDRVKNWITVNEVHCFTRLAYGGGDKAPGANEPAQIVNQTYHHALLAHGYAMSAIREYGGRGARAGITDNCHVAIPVTETPADIAAATRWFRDANAQVLAPIFTGRYPENFLRRCGADRPQVARGDLALISQPTDFLGLNIYSGAFIRAGRRGAPEALPYSPSYPRTDAEWLTLAPQSLYWGPRLAAEVFGAKALYITENGAGYDDDTPNERGEVIDLHRRDYLRTYLAELQRATRDGVPVKGYFVWSLLDNFEWQDGYQRRFGIVHNDFATQRRTPKLSAHWYSQVARANRLL
ncbi:MAG: GH1 family beta-glucosidase [Opitutus sp.]|nr:GH1 family beta-glucosidase [Opitutus sp.]